MQAMTGDQAWYYRVSGTTIISHVRMPSLPEIDSTEIGESPVTIRQGSVPDDLPGAKVIHEGYKVGDRTVLVTPVGGFRFLARNGLEIISDLENPDDPDLLQFHLTGSVLTAILFQRGIIPFHAAAVVVANKAVAICALSKRGKSTLAAFLAAKGHLCITDDRLVIETRGSRFFAVPGAPWFHLDDASIASLGVSAPGSNSSAGGFGKKIVAVPDLTHENPVELGAMVILDRVPGRDEPALERLGNFDALESLRSQINYEGYVRAMSLEGSAFDLVSGIVRDVPVYRLDRGDGFSQLPEMAEKIEKVATW